MTFWKKVVMAVMMSVAVFLVQGAVNATPAHASMYKFTFKGDQANGYFIYDGSVEPNKNAPFKSPYLAAYYGAGRDFEINLGDKGNFTGKMSNVIVHLPHLKEDAMLSKLKNQHDEQYGDDTYDVTSPADFILMQIRNYEREPQSQYTLATYFKYPSGTFHDSTASPTEVPSNAEVAVFPTVDFPKTLGKPAFIGNVETRIEKVSD
jgi:hypothetical protein